MHMESLRTIDEVRDSVLKLKGRTVPLKVNKGRNRIVHLSATIDQVYTNMFIIKPTEVVDLDRMSYSYSDVLCGDICFL